MIIQFLYNTAAQPRRIKNTYFKENWIFQKSTNAISQNYLLNQVIGQLLPGSSMLMNDLPPFFSLEENQRLTVTPLFLLPILNEGKVRVISGNAEFSEHINFQILDLQVEV